MKFIDQIKKFIKKNIDFKALFGLTIAITITITITYNINLNKDKDEYNKIYDKDSKLTWETYKITHKDSRGNKLRFLVAILSQEKRWAFGSSEMLENNQNFDNHFQKYFSLLPSLNDCNEFFAIGVASHEGSTKTEFCRADRRADKILEALRLVTRNKILYKLNLGKFKNRSDKFDSSSERRVIVGAIYERDNDMTLDDIKLALYEALEKNLKDKLGFSLFDYNDFEFTQPY